MTQYTDNNQEKMRQHERSAEINTGPLKVLSARYYEDVVAAKNWFYINPQVLSTMRHDNQGVIDKAIDDLVSPPQSSGLTSSIVNPDALKAGQDILSAETARRTLQQVLDAAGPQEQKRLDHYAQ